VLLVELTVKELLSCSFFSKANVLAGHQGLNAIVTSVTVLDSPDAPKYMKGGELVVSSAYSLLNNEFLQQEVIKNLAKKGSAALGLMLRFFDNKLPIVIKETADKYNFPVISLPDEYAYRDIYEFISTNMYSRFSGEIKRKDEVFNEITNSIYDEGLVGVVKALYKWTGLLSVILFENRVIAYPNSEIIFPEILTDISNWEKFPSSNEHSFIVNRYCMCGNNAVEWLAVDILVDGKTHGSVLLFKNESREYVKEDYLLLECASYACAQEIKKMKSIINVQRLYHNDFMDKFLNCDYTWEEICSSSRKLDFNIPKEGFVLAIKFDFNIEIDNFLDYKKVVNTLQETLGYKVLYGLYKDIFVVYLPNDEEKFLPKIKLLHDRLKKCFGEKFIIGVGRPVHYSEVRKSLEQAVFAINLSFCANLKLKIFEFSKIGVFRLLKNDEQEMIRYYEDFLKPLERDRKNVKIHTHSSENQSECKLVEELFGMRNVKCFEKLGLIGPNLILAHCIWLDEEEMNILASSQTNVVHCPSSNLKLASGIAKVPDMLAKGCQVSIAADSAACNNNLDPWMEMRIAALIQKPLHGPTAMPAWKVFELATLGGAKVMGRENEIGSLEVGKKADLVVLDLKDFHVIPQSNTNIYSRLVYEAKSSDVETTIVNGKVLMQNRKLMTIDAERLKSQVEIEIKRVAQRANVLA
jgi:hypothetical protein